MDCTPIFKDVLNASRELVFANTGQINTLLNNLAEKVVNKIPAILKANKLDLQRMDVNDPKYDRLKLTENRIKDIAADIRNVAQLDSPLGKIRLETIRPNGMKIQQVSVPFGVIGIIYEARPNVTLDVFSLCLKSGNACILKGGSDAIDSNTILVSIIQEVLIQNGLNKNLVALLPAGREETQQLLNAHGFVDLIIPRGSQSLIDFVRKNASIPVIETGAGICHTYFDEFGDKDKGRKIIYNAKTRRVSVCNALDCVIIHKSRLADLFYIVTTCAEKNVEIFADEDSYQELEGKYPANLLKRATNESFGTEFLDYKMAIKVVGDIAAAIAHIALFSSKHSEAIVTENEQNALLFQKAVDAAAVYVNVSTAFTDGAQFGLGAEIGISTQKLHARGPMALTELTSYKWLVTGNGQVRN